MRNTTLFTALFFTLFFTACGPSETEEPVVTDTVVEATPDEIVYSFAFVGCNRVDWKDTAIGWYSNASTANIPALTMIVEDVVNAPRKVDAFFFLGDIVVGESDTCKLNTQLEAWKTLLKDSTSILSSGIELIAVPGNHEMLESGSTEVPLEGTTDIWMRHMADYLPSDRVSVSEDSLNNRMTFSFVRDSIAFIVMNTDTYNGRDGVYGPSQSSSCPGHISGIEGVVPTAWITQQIESYTSSNAIKEVFVLGHKPALVSGVIRNDHSGFVASDTVWNSMSSEGALAMLSAHKHYYDRFKQYEDGTTTEKTVGPYQVIAGDGGSPPESVARFFGYTQINIYKSGKVELVTKGAPINATEYYMPSDSALSIRDTATLTFDANASHFHLPD